MLTFPLRRRLAIFIFSSSNQPLQIEDYRHDRGVDSETEVLDDDTSDEISEVCDTSVPIKHHCIACKKKSFKCNEEKLYIQHLRYDNLLHI